MFTRRTLLKRALVAGGVAPYLLAGCGNPSSLTKPIDITWASELGGGDFYTRLVTEFNDLHYGVSVTSHELQNYQALVNQLSHPNGPDIVSLDIVWINPFASQGLIMPLDLWSQSERAAYFPKAWKVVTVDNKIYAAPFRLDLGMLFYRKSLTNNTAPATWDDLASAARSLLRNRKTTYGYIWQGYTDITANPPYGEALFCNYLEVLASYNGTFDLHDLSTITSSQAQLALSTMVNWIGDISPREVVYSSENVTTSSWKAGAAAFMRNWPDDYASSDIGGSKVGSDFGIAPLPGLEPGQVGRSCLGGWCLAINASSPPERKDAASAFIQWMMGKGVQQLAIMNNSWLVTYQEAYQNMDITIAYPYFTNMNIPTMIDQAIVRPSTPDYYHMSQKIYIPLHQALQRKISPEQALQDIQDSLKKRQKASKHL
jgi:multiple sugar transport system substrate-binding protein